jgi:FAD/FMN-containing dehydrogenase
VKMVTAVKESLVKPINSRWAGLQARIVGRVVAPDDPDYDRLRKAWNLTVDQHPAVIVVARNAADVAAAVQFARWECLGISVQSTGHGVVRPANDSLLIVTSEMRDIRVDAASQTAWIEAGASGVWCSKGPRPSV